MDSTITNDVGKLFGNISGKNMLHVLLWERAHGWLNYLRMGGSIMNDVLYSCRLLREQITRIAIIIQMMFLFFYPESFFFPPL